MVKLYWFLAFTFLVPLHSLAQTLSTSVDPTNGSIQDTFEFTITITQPQGNEVPHLVGGKDFQLRYIGSSSSLSIINSRQSHAKQFVYELVPKKTGELESPSVEIDVNGKLLKSAPLSIKVSKAAKNTQNTGSSSEITLKRSLNKNQVYEGEQLLTTLELVSPYRIEKGSFDNLQYEGFWKEELGSPTVRSGRLGGRPVSVHKIEHALFPLRNGQITLPPVRLDLTVRKPQKRAPSAFSRFGFFDPNFFSVDALSRVVAVSRQATLSVLPLPTPPSNTASLSYQEPIVGNTSLSLGYDTNEVKVGESKTITITIKSEGNLRPIDNLRLDLPSYVRSYPDTPEEKVIKKKGYFRLQKKFRISLVPEKPGNLKIPPIQLLVFNPKKKSYEVKKTREISFNVTGTAASSDNTQLFGEEEILDNRLEDNEPQRTLYRYKEEGMLEYLSRAVSFPLALLCFTILCFIAGSIYLGGRLYRLALSKRAIQPPDFNAVESALELREAFLSATSRALGSDSLTLRGKSLESEIEKKFPGKSYGVQTGKFVDKLQAYTFGEDAKDEVNLSQLKEEATELATLLWR